MTNHIWTDTEILEALDMVERRGMSRSEAARAMTQNIGKPITRNAIVGLLHRVRNETNAFDDAQHQNGTMPARWWAKREGE